MAAYREDELVVDVHLDLLDVLEFEGEILHNPVVATTVLQRLDDEDVRHDLLARAAPHLTTTEQHLFEVVHVPRTTRSVRVVGSHRHRIVVLGSLIVDYHRGVVAWRLCMAQQTINYSSFNDQAKNIEVADIARRGTEQYELTAY